MHRFDAVSYIALRDEFMSRKDRDKEKDLPEEDPDFFLKRVFREYAKTYHTPLHLVPELPLLDVLEAYYAENYSQASDEALEDLIRKVSVSNEDKKKADIIKDRMDALDFEDIGESQAQNAKIARKLESGIPQIRDALQEMVKQSRGGREQEMVPTKGRGALPAKTTPPNIAMKFVSEEEMERLLNGDNFDIFPEKK